MKQHLIALICGILFGIGLSLSHMINPNKVLNFLDISDNWDPSLIFVMMGALAVAFISFKWILKRPAPVLAESFHISGKSSIDKTLILGAAIFGIGWGMSGYCWIKYGTNNVGFGAIWCIAKKNMIKMVMRKS